MSATQLQTGYPTEFPTSMRPDECWTFDFVAKQLNRRTSLRLLVDVGFLEVCFEEVGITKLFNAGAKHFSAQSLEA